MTLTFKAIVSDDPVRLVCVEYPEFSIGTHTDNEEQFEASWPPFEKDKYGANCSRIFGDEHDTLVEAVQELKDLITKYR